ncbi:MAG: hypothetical protein AB7P40_29965 [Chloroflexota bacterium]
MKTGHVQRAMAAVGLALALSVTMVFPTLAATVVTTVTPADLENDKLTAYNNGKWFIYNDENDQIENATGTFVAGPATPPVGVGSVQLSVSGSQRKNIATYRFKGTPLASITTLQFSTYNPSAGNGGAANRSGYLQFNVDFDGSDTWQRRLIYVPSDNGTVLQDTWQAWDAIAGGSAQWKYSGATWPVSGGSGFNMKTWSQILSEYPGVRIRVTDSFLGVRVGEPYTNGYTENVDAVVFGTASGTTVFNFEPTIGPPTDKNQCKGDGWKQFNTPAFKNQGDCVSYVATHGRNPGNGR